MMKRCTAIIILGYIAANAAALDFGINLSNSTALSGFNDVSTAEQSNNAEAFIKIPTGRSSSLYFSGDARFYGIFPCTPQGKPNILPLTQVFRVGRTEWAGQKAVGSAGIQWAIGRTPFSDYSKKILYGLFDGARVSFTLPKATIGFAAGYTGLTYKTDAKIRIDNKDRKRMIQPKTILAPPRLFFLFSSDFPLLIPAHVAGFEVLSQFDVSPQKAKTHTQYLIPYIHGAVGKHVSWKLWGALMLGEDAQFFHSWASGLAVQYFNPDWLNFTLKGTLDWASGDGTGQYMERTFIPITDLKIALIAESRFQDILHTSVSTYIKPLQGLHAGLTYSFLTTPGVFKRQPYIGSELLGKVAYCFYDDFDISFLCGIFVPNQNRQSAHYVRWLTELAFTVRL